MAVEGARAARVRRHRRVRASLSGSAERPRLCVFRSLNHIYAQLVDDDRSQTLAAASTIDPEFKGRLNGQKKAAQAEMVGDLMARRTIDLGIKQIVFDRGGYKYHGRVKSLAEAMRKAGVSF